MKETGQVREAEIVVVPQVEDVIRITWEHAERREAQEREAAMMAWRQAKKAERLKKQRALRIAGACACVLFFAIGVLTALRAGVWAGLPAWLLAGIALSVTGW